jgi:hypothetical protein
MVTDGGTGEAGVVADPDTPEASTETLPPPPPPQPANSTGAATHSQRIEVVMPVLFQDTTKNVPSPSPVAGIAQTQKNRLAAVSFISANPVLGGLLQHPGPT